MKKQCESCGIVKGGAICREVLTEYREHSICGWCRAEWRYREKFFRREISFDEFNTGRLERGVRNATI